ncbi:TPA: phenylalanine--tRNA ligase subunit beta, partial [Candidatus Woesearchaeota archaeon]|nr:phenylalanine--tRNA ligase subunit beta [Candidatus Woesearchaeota archaeon]
MPTITLNRKVFENLVGRRLPDEKLKDRISMLGTDIESVSEREIVVEVFPNRPDMLSEQGFARAFSSFIGEKSGLRPYTAKKSDYEVIIEKGVDAVRPWTACAVVKGISFDGEKIKEVIQIQEKLHVTYGRNRKKVAIGVYPLEKIAFPVRFVGEDPKKVSFQPLEFPKEITGLQVLSQHPAGREYGHLLEGKDRFPFFIDSAGKVLSMPPIINSHDVGKITESSSEVFIECSGFDYDVLHRCLCIIVTALADMGGEIYSVAVKKDGKALLSPDLSPHKHAIALDAVNKRLGLSLKETELKKHLAAMGIGYEKGHALVPCYRADVLHEVDLIEAVAIAYGYDKFEENIPSVATIASESPFAVFVARIANILVGLGLLEVMTYHLASVGMQQEKMCSDIPLVALANAESLEYNTCRAWMIPCLLDVLQKNKLHEYPQHIFDCGTCFMPAKKSEDSDTGVVEHDRLAVALCSENADYTAIRQVLDYVLRTIGVGYAIRPVEHPSFIAGRVGRVTVAGKDVAYIGEIHPEVLAHFELKFPVAAFELNMSTLFGDVILHYPE